MVELSISDVRLHFFVWRYTMKNLVTAQNTFSTEILLKFLVSSGFNPELDLQKLSQVPERCILQVCEANPDIILKVDTWVRALYSDDFGRISTYYQGIDLNYLIGSIYHQLSLNMQCNYSPLQLDQKKIQLNTSAMYYL